MGTSGNPTKQTAPAKKTAASKKKTPQVADASAFKKRAQGTVLELPSGLAVMAKRIELQTLIIEGNIPNPLMEAVSGALEKGQKANISEMVGVEEGQVNLDTVRDMYDMVNQVVIESIVQPKVHEVPEDKDDRDDDLLYVDEVDPTDKMFIFQWASGGTADLERFREEARADMDALAEIQGSGSKTE